MDILPQQMTPKQLGSWAERTAKDLLIPNYYLHELPDATRLGVQTKFGSALLNQPADFIVYPRTEVLDTFTPAMLFVEVKATANKSGWSLRRLRQGQRYWLRRSPYVILLYSVEYNQWFLIDRHYAKFRDANLQASLSFKSLMKDKKQWHDPTLPLPIT